MKADWFSALILHHKSFSVGRYLLLSKLNGLSDDINNLGGSKEKSRGDASVLKSRNIPSPRLGKGNEQRWTKLGKVKIQFAFRFFSLG